MYGQNKPTIFFKKEQIAFFSLVTHTGNLNQMNVWFGIMRNERDKQLTLTIQTKKLNKDNSLWVEDV